MASLSRSKRLKNFADFTLPTTPAREVTLLLLTSALSLRDRTSARDPTLCRFGSASSSDSGGFASSSHRSGQGLAMSALSFSLRLLESSRRVRKAPLQYCTMWSRNRLLVAGRASSVECRRRKAATAARACGLPADACDINDGRAGVTLHI